MIWLREHEPEILDRAARIAEADAYLKFRLTGCWSTSVASADPTGTLDMRTRQWSAEILDAAGIDRRKMPPPVAPGTPTGEATEAAAAATGLRRGTRVIAGGGDGQCAGAGVGVGAPASPMSIWGLLSSPAATEPITPTIARSAPRSRSRTRLHLRDLPALRHVLVHRRPREMFQAETTRLRDLLPKLEAEAAAEPIGAGGVGLAPDWQACTTRHWDSVARGTSPANLGSTHRGDDYRSLLEGIALEQAICTNQAEQATARRSTAMSRSGGGAASDLVE